MTTSYRAKSSKSKSWLNIVKVRNLLQYNTDINAQDEMRRGITICPFNNSTCVVCYITISTGRTTPFEWPDRTWLHPIQPRAPSLNLGSTLSKFKIFYSTIQTSMLKLSCVKASQYVPWCLNSIRIPKIRNTQNETNSFIGPVLCVMIMNESGSRRSSTKKTETHAIRLSFSRSVLRTLLECRI